MNIRRPMCCLAVGFLLFISILIKTFHFIPNDYDMLKGIKDGDTVDFDGIVCDKSAGNDRTVLYIKHCNVGAVSDCGLIAYPDDENELLPQMLSDNLPIGSRVSCTGKIYRFDEPENFGQFNTREYYYIRGYNGRIADCCITSSKGSAGLREALWQLRESIKQTYSSYLNESDAGIMTAVMLGDKTNLDKDIKSLYQLSGITHILSLSGLHIATLGLALLNLLIKVIRAVFARTRLCDDLNVGGIKSVCAAGMISTLVMLLYFIMTGMNVSTLRALVMYFLGLAAKVSGRSYDLLSAAAFSSLIAVLVNPLYIYDAGFQLSFMAVVSIGLINPALIEMCSGIGKYKITQGILLSVSIQLGTFPIVAYHYYRIPLMGIVLNLIVVPLMSIVLLCGVIIALFGSIFSVTSLQVSYYIGWLAGKITHVIFWVYEHLSLVASDFKWNLIITGKPKPLQVISYYLVLLVVLILIRSTAGGSLKIKVIANSVTVILLMSGFVLITFSHKTDYAISNLSVGQGDCTVIRNESKVMIIDCGSTTENQVGTYRLIPYLLANGVSSVDTVFISHFDSDHVNGIIELLEDEYYSRRIGCIVISKAAPLIDGHSENYATITAYSQACNIPVYTIAAGEGMVIGDSIIQCLSPVNDRVEEYEDTNSASMILDITDRVSGFRMLLTGDADFASEDMMYNSRIGYDYLKVAHHGSNSSTSDMFLNKFINCPVIYNGKYRINLNYQNRYNSKAYIMGKKMCVISVGEGNRYGHPGEDLLMRLEKYYQKNSIFRTDLMYEIDVIIR